MMLVLPQSEANFQRTVKEAAELLGWRVYHETDSRKSAAGKPDLELTHPRHGSLYLELKVGKNRPSREQVEWIDWYRHCGIPAYVVWPEDWEAIEAMLHGNRVELVEVWR